VRWYPQMSFPWTHNGGSIQAHSDAPIVESAAEVIALAESRICRCR
jgi:hypothetical protein